VNILKNSLESFLALLSHFRCVIPFWNLAATSGAPVSLDQSGFTVAGIFQNGIIPVENGRKD